MPTHHNHCAEPLAAEAMLARMEGRNDMEKVLDTGFEVIEREST
jgi:hypothetical protein